MLFIVLYSLYTQVQLLVLWLNPLKKKQESLYYIRPTDIRFLVVGL